MERANGTHTESAYGGYEVVDSDFNGDDLKGKLLEWERIYPALRYGPTRP